jgi:hypothetical protein
MPDFLFGLVYKVAYGTRQNGALGLRTIWGWTGAGRAAMCSAEICRSPEGSSGGEDGGIDGGKDTCSP